LEGLLDAITRIEQRLGLPLLTERRALYERANGDRDWGEDAFGPSHSDARRGAIPAPAVVTRQNRDRALQRQPGALAFEAHKRFEHRFLLGPIR
jgi:hypothetical protein